MFSVDYLLFFIIYKKLIKSGKRKNILQIKSYLSFLKKQNILIKAISNLMLPIKFKTKKIGYVQHCIPVLIHFYISVNLAVLWLLKATKVKAFKKMSFSKALYLECHEVLKKQGTAWKYREQYLKKALTNTVFMYLLNPLNK